MAHEFEIRDGRTPMFHVCRDPWQGLGARLDRPATAVEAIKAARLGRIVWKVTLQGVSGGASVA